MKLLITALLCLPVFTCFSQQTIDVTKQDVRGAQGNIFFLTGGEPFVNVKFTKLVNGTPYFSDDWMKGFAFADSSSRYTGIFRIDLIDNKIHFLNAKGEEMVTTTRMQKLILTDTIKQDSFNLVHSAAIQATNITPGWYQQLAETNSSTLLKRCVKRLREIRPYNASTVEQYIDDTYNYYILHDEKMIELKKIQDMAEVFPDKKADVLKYISDNKLKGRSDTDYIKVLSFCKLL